jgi:GMP synthase (glutamine-hydrolysing)
MKPVLMLQNDAGEGPGLLRTLLNERGIPMAPHEGEALRDAGEFDPADYLGLVILGGGQGVYEQDRYPYLTQEIRLCRRFVDAGRPMLGLCLGAQILAVAMGGQVRPNDRKEIGWGDVELTDEARSDPLLADLPARFPVFHFHGDVFMPPDGVPVLASTPLTACQVARYGAGVYGFQCHPEVDPALVEHMCHNAADYMRANGFDPETVIAGSAAYLSASMIRGRLILNRWIDRLESPA